MAKYDFIENWYALLDAIVNGLSINKALVKRGISAPNKNMTQERELNKEEKEE